MSFVKIDRDDFIKYFNLWQYDKITGRQFRDKLGICDPALKMRIKRLKENGVLEGKYFTDGGPVYFAYVKIGVGDIRHPRIGKREFKDTDVIEVKTRTWR